MDINKVLNRIKNRDNKSSNVLEGFYDNDFWKLFMINIFSHEDKEKKKKKEQPKNFASRSIERAPLFSPTKETTRIKRSMKNKTKSKCIRKSSQPVFYLIKSVSFSTVV